MKNELIKLADHLDKKGMHREANYLDAVIKKSALTDEGLWGRDATSPTGASRHAARSRQILNRMKEIAMQMDALMAMNNELFAELQSLDLPGRLDLKANYD